MLVAAGLREKEDLALGGSGGEGRHTNSGGEE